MIGAGVHYYDFVRMCVFPRTKYKSALILLHEK